MRADNLHLRGANILCRRYTLPEKTASGLLYFPEPWRTPGDRAVWEPVRWGPETEHRRPTRDDPFGGLGVPLTEHCLLFTQPHRGVAVPLEDGEHFIIDAREVRSVQFYEP